MADRCIFCRLYYGHCPEQIAIKYNAELCICTDCLKLGRWIFKTVLKELKKNEVV